MANATSVTLNLLSTSQSAAAPRTTAAVHPSCQKCGLMRSSSARKVNAQRNPHHAAGRTLSPRHSNRGIYQRRSTPRITATRGWSEDTASRDVEEAESEATWEPTVDDEGGTGGREEGKGGGGSSGWRGGRRNWALRGLRNRGWGWKGGGRAWRGWGGGRGGGGDGLRGDASLELRLRQPCGRDNKSGMGYLSSWLLSNGSIGGIGEW
ncbi:hypothetical protein FQN53_007889 [Emmonsiellopsis sp. PD_33]|nr:hypothetical protein FQN53_007889 [Emmonsiellopsis sp. PD_33]